MDLGVLENKVYNYSVDIIGFMMILKKAHLNNANTNNIVSNAGLLNTGLMDAFDMKGDELKHQIGQCVEIVESLKINFDQMQLHESFEDEKANLQIETIEVKKLLLTYYEKLT